MSRLTSVNGINLVAAIIAAFFHVYFPVDVSAQSVGKNKETVTIDSSRPLRIFDPNRDLGAGIDGHSFGEIDQLLRPSNVAEMLAAGFKPVTYRLRTELAVDAWHWNPVGSWSDERKKQGYWTSDGRSDGEISLSYGYSLPRRGDSIDQANDDGYSRIDDGDPESFWKSNPFLDKHFTGEDNALHRQWLVIDLGEEKPIDAIRISWGLPFAVEYEVQYGKIKDISDISHNPPGLWHTFPNGRVLTKTGGEITTKLTATPLKTRYLRVLLKQSSYVAAADSSDVRDKLGVAVREIFAGTMSADGNFSDEVRHGRRATDQTNMIVSSNDPWHQATDIDSRAEHVGLDRFFKSGLTNDAPALIPVSLLFGTPEDSAAEIAYLQQKGYKISGVELGEEPDGQYMAPEDYGALYIQWADAIHRVAPALKLGGPSFQEVQPDERKPELGNAVWLGRFINYLEKRHRAADFSFFSFEWYPFDNVCGPTAPQLAKTARLLKTSIDAFRRHGLNRNIPLIISEYGYSAFAAQAEVDVEGALFNADSVGTFLAIGGSQAYLYGYEASIVDRNFPCTAGNNTLFLGDEALNIKYRTATYFGARLIMQEWLQPSGGDHKFVRSTVTAKNGRGTSAVAAYTVQRPDNTWSVMLINRDPQKVAEIDLRFINEKGRTPSRFVGDVDLYQFSGQQYKWDAKLQIPAKSDPPEHTRLNGLPTTHTKLPPYSLTVIRGNLK